MKIIVSVLWQTNFSEILFETISGTLTRIGEAIQYFSENKNLCVVMIKTTYSSRHQMWSNRIPKRYKDLELRPQCINEKLHFGHIGQTQSCVAYEQHTSGRDSHICLGKAMQNISGTFSLLPFYHSSLICKHRNTKI